MYSRNALAKSAACLPRAGTEQPRRGRYDTPASPASRASGTAPGTARAASGFAATPMPPEHREPSPPKSTGFLQPFAGIVHFPGRRPGGMIAAGGRP